MIIKNAEVKSTIINTVMCITILTIITFGFKLYHDSKFVKDEYERICPQNYGDPISLDRCYWSYKFEGNTLNTAIKAEVAALFVVPVLILLASLI